MAVLAAVVRGIARRSSATLGNFWVDLYRSLVYILLPLRVVVAVDPDLAGRAADLPRARDRDDAQGATQTIARGPVASQIAIKQLGTNGGGFYNSNSAVPFENPNGLSNFLEMLVDPADPGGAGVHVREDGARAPPRLGGVRGDVRASSRSASRVNLPAEQHGSAVLRDSGVNITQGDGQSGGNMADKEVRFGIADTAIWTVATSDASNGSVNGGFDALTPRRRRGARSSTCSSAR